MDLFPSAPAIVKNAVISPDGIYRYRLDRIWGPEHFLPFVMLNPSTADAEVDDPTIRRCMSFARRGGYGGITVANLFALRATNPDALRGSHAWAFGPGNYDALSDLAGWSARAGVPVVCAWGAGGIIHDGDVTGIDILKTNGARLVCLGRTKDGQPRHPLYVKGTQPLEPFP